MWRFPLCLCVLGTVLGFVAIDARAEEPVDGPNRIFNDELIEQLAGDWELTRQIRGTQVQNAVRAEWVLNHQFLRLHMKDVAQPPAYEALVLIGYSHADKTYVAHWCDTFGGKFSADGFGQRSGNAIEFRFEYPDGPFFNTFTWDPIAKGWTFRMESQKPDGMRTLFAEDTLRRPVRSSTSGPEDRAPKSTFLVVYKPGPAWIVGKPLKEQPLKEHFRYMLSLYAAGALRFAGPFTDDSGGAVQFVAADETEAKSIVNGDPAVTSGLFVYELRPWTLVDWEGHLKKQRPQVPVAQAR